MAQITQTLFNRPFSEFRTRYRLLKRDAAIISGCVFAYLGVIWLIGARYMEEFHTLGISPWTNWILFAVIVVLFLNMNRNKNTHIPYARRGSLAISLDMTVLMSTVMLFSFLLFIINELLGHYQQANFLAYADFTAYFFLCYGLMLALARRQPGGPSFAIFFLLCYIGSHWLDAEKVRIPVFDLFLWLSILLLAATFFPKMCAIGYDYSKNFYWRASASLLELGTQLFTFSLSNVLGNPLTKQYEDASTVLELQQWSQCPQQIGSGERGLLGMLIRTYELPQDTLFYMTEFRITKWAGIFYVHPFGRRLRRYHSPGESLRLEESADRVSVNTSLNTFPLPASAKEVVDAIRSRDEEPLCLVWDMPRFSLTLMRILIVSQKATDKAA